MATNDLIWQTSTQVSLQTSGASMSNSAAPVSGGTLATSSHGGMTSADMVLFASFTASHSSGSIVNLYERWLDVDSTNDEDAPGASNKAHLVGVAIVPGSSASSTHYMVIPDIVTRMVPVEYFIENLSNTAIGLGWTLKATPKTVTPRT